MRKESPFGLWSDQNFSQRRYARPHK
jgi:hypothetical protein